MTTDGGKGATPRPLGVSIEEFDKNFDAIFGARKSEPIPFGGIVELNLTQNEKELIIKDEWKL